MRIIFFAILDQLSLLFESKTHATFFENTTRTRAFLKKDHPELLSDGVTPTIGWRKFK